MARKVEITPTLKRLIDESAAAVEKDHNIIEVRRRLSKNKQRQK